MTYALLWMRNSASYPQDAIAIDAGGEIEAAINNAGEGAVFCLKNGIYRMQALRPRARQHFYSEAATILNGSRLLIDVPREDRYWVARSQPQLAPRHWRMPAQRSSLRSAR
jgi:hypothetical protein